jgi:hypothetical protein
VKETFILFLMFFVSPPAKPGKQVWTLSSTQHFEFASMEGCKAFGIHLQTNFIKTQTTTVRGWCVSQATGGATADERNAAADQRQKNADTPDLNYYEIPPLGAQ